MVVVAEVQKARVNGIVTRCQICELVGVGCIIWYTSLKKKIIVTYVSKSLWLATDDQKSLVLKFGRTEPLGRPQSLSLHRRR